MKEYSIILDLHGIIYFHTKDLAIEESEKKFETVFAQYQNNGFKGTDLQFEQDAITNGLQSDKFLPLYFPPTVISTISRLQSRYNLVFFSNALPHTIDIILSQLAQKTGGQFNAKNSTKFSSLTGSKAEQSTWEKVLRTIEQPLSYTDDKPKYRNAAQTTAKKLNIPFRVFESYEQCIDYHLSETTA